MLAEKETKDNKKQKNKSVVTSKKTKIVGKKDYIDAETGEIQSMNVISCENRDFNFHKIWLGHMISSLDLIGNQKLRVVIFILDNLDYENKFCMTYREIERQSKISLFTVRNTMKALLDSNFLHMLHKGVYRVNPNMIFKGQHSHRMNILLQYSKEETSRKSDLTIVK